MEARIISQGKLDKRVFRGRANVRNHRARTCHAVAQLVRPALPRWAHYRQLGYLLQQLTPNEMGGGDYGEHFSASFEIIVSNST